MSKKFTGTGVAVITPFHKDGSIDFASFSLVIEHLITNNIGYIVTMGTTGEAVVLNKDERNAILNFVVEVVDKRVPVVVGAGGNNTLEVLNTITSYAYEDVNAILSVTPFYNKPHQKGLLQHYKMIASHAPVPVILYNVPDRTGVNMEAETTLELGHTYKNIIGIKEASKRFVQCNRIIKDRPEGFLVISGDDITTIPMIALGGDGAISVTANAFPREFSDMVSYALKGNFKSARHIQHRLTDFMCSIFIDGNPAGIKAAMDILKLSQNYLRLPSVPVTRSTYNIIKNAIESILVAV